MAPDEAQAGYSSQTGFCRVGDAGGRGASDVITDDRHS